MSKENNSIPVWLNPLKMLNINIGMSEQRPVDAKELLCSLCMPGQSSEIDDVISRYKEIDTDGNLLAFPPADQQILEKLIWPLRAAKTSYVTGNYLGTIALCGMVAEMIAVLNWEIAEIILNGKQLSPADEKNMFGKCFEELGQARRIKILFAYGLIDQETMKHLDDIRKIRNPYLHSFSKEHLDIRKDAVSAYTLMVKIVSKIIGQEIKDGKIAVNPKLLYYLKKQHA